jgi:hypothetical protein
MADWNAILATLRGELGKPYVWGAEGPSSFDCSGLVQFVYGQHGVSLPRTSAAQSKVGTTIAKGAQLPGDLVFSSWDGNAGVDHVSIYIGGGQVIEAPAPGQRVKVTPLSSGYLSHVTNIQRPAGLGPTTDVPGAGVGGGAFDGVTNALNGIGKSFTSIADTASVLHVLSLPTTWVRVSAGVAGTALLFFGLWKLVGEVRT